MAPDAKDTFVLFDVGHDESMLRLGDLVLYDYNNPLTTRHYTCQQLPRDDATASTRLSNFSIFHMHGPRTGVQLEAAGFIKLGVSLGHDDGRLVVAESAERVVLRNPTDYLREVVLADGAAREALALWLSAGLSERILKLKWARRPKIWMMTGMYLFQGTKIVTVRSHTVGGEIGISSELVASLSSAPVGGSVSRSNTTFAEISMDVPDRKVWAAQYQLLNARYIDPLKSADTDATISTISLYPDITSRGRLRSSRVSPRTTAIGPFGEESDTSDDETYQSSGKPGDHSLVEAAYVEELERTVQSFQEELGSDSASDG